MIFFPKVRGRLIACEKGKSRLAQAKGLPNNYQPILSLWSTMLCIFDCNKMRNEYEYANDLDDGMFEQARVIIYFFFPRPTHFSFFTSSNKMGWAYSIDYLFLAFISPLLKPCKLLSVFFSFFRQISKAHFESFKRKTNQSPVFWFCVNTLMGLLNNFKISNQIELRHSPHKYKSDTNGM